VLAGVAAGATHREAAERFGVSAASVSRWRTREREQGKVRPKALGGDRKSGRIDAHKEAIVEALGPEADRSIEEVRWALQEQGLVFGFGSLQRFFKRHAITRKKRPPMRRSRTVPTS
jgi:transposase